MPDNVFQHNHLSIEIPDGWEDASNVVLIGPEENGFRPNLVYARERAEPGESAIDFAVRQLPQLKEVLTGYRLISEGLATFGPNSGFLREHTFELDKGDVGQIQFYMVIDGSAHTVTLTHLPEQFERFKSLAGKLLANVRLNLGDNVPPDHTDTVNL